MARRGGTLLALIGMLFHDPNKPPRETKTGFLGQWPLQQRTIIATLPENSLPALGKRIAKANTLFYFTKSQSIASVKDKIC